MILLHVACESVDQDQQRESVLCPGCRYIGQIEFYMNIDSVIPQVEFFVFHHCFTLEFQVSLHCSYIDLYDFFNLYFNLYYYRVRPEWERFS